MQFIIKHIIAKVLNFLKKQYFRKKTFFGAGKTGKTGILKKTGSGK
jgi:hypothetical protein